MSPLPAAKCRAVHPVASKYFKNGKEKKSREKEEGRRGKKKVERRKKGEEESREKEEGRRGTKKVERRKKGNGRRDKELYEKKT